MAVAGYSQDSIVMIYTYIFDTNRLEEHYEMDSFFTDHTNQYQMHKDSNDIECAVLVTQLYKPCQLFSLSDKLCG